MPILFAFKLTIFEKFNPKIIVILIFHYISVLYSGWKPVLIAMSISSLGGLILDKAVSKFSGIAVFQPLFNGVGGNLVAVQASRISTYLHLNVRTVIDKYETYVIKMSANDNNECA